MVKVLLLGSTGLLGQAIAAETLRRGYALRDAARKSASIVLDIADDNALMSVLRTEAPDLVINCAAITDLETCENDPLLAYRVQARPLAFLADWSRASAKPFVHVSTDHFFTEGAQVAHDEMAQVTLVNEYARTKFAGEAFALTAPRALVLRTSIVGIRGWKDPTFAEWAIGVALSDAPVTMFSDAYTSSIDVASFASAAFDLFNADAAGLLNLASCQVYSKEAFVREVARQLRRPLTQAKTGSIRSLTTRRANCLGLDVAQAEGILGYRLPTLERVVASVLAQYDRSSKNEI